MILQRVLTALVGIPVVLYAVYRGGLFLGLLVAAVASLCAVEFKAIAQKSGAGPALDSLLVPTLAFLAGSYVDPDGAGPVQWGFLAFGVVYVLIRELGRWASVRSAASGAVPEAPRMSFISNASAALLGSVYTGWFLGHFLRLRQLPGGLWFTFMLLVAIWVSDSAAYFVGIPLGKRKICPAISPGKSVEGALAGVAGASIAGGLAATFLGNGFYWGASFGLAVSVAGQAGDFVESGFKRDAGVKDSGKLLPGHGGIMDRFDSLVFASVVAYYFVLLVPGWR